MEGTVCKSDHIFVFFKQVISENVHLMTSLLKNKSTRVAISWFFFFTKHSMIG